MRVLICSTTYGFDVISPAVAKYSGMERAVWYTANEMIKRGHAVTIATDGRCDLDDAEVIPYNHMDNFVQWVGFNTGRWDVLHDFSHDLSIATALRDEMACLSTLENPNDPKDAPNVVTVSQYHQWYTREYYGRETKVVYNAVDGAHYPFYPGKRHDYVLQMGATESRKGALDSIKAARQAGVQIQAAGLPSNDKDYQKNIDDLVDGKTVVWRGNVGGKEKEELLGNARAVMMFMKWPEPGSYLGIEATCMGTPIICNGMGCPKEYGIRDETLIQVEDESQLPQAIEAAKDINPSKVREFWESSELRSSVMADRYEELYRRVLDHETW
jgi:glycosyltransferase involved in cell wall biosynthesis